MMGQYRWAVLAAIFLSIPASWAGPCQSSVQGPGFDIFNCSKAELDSMPSLPKEAQVLDFSGNHFKSLPLIEESPACTACAETNPSVHCRLDISFRRNHIKTLEPRALRELKCLHTLDLSYNDIKADLFHHFVQGVYYLEILNLRGNPLGQLPDSVIADPFMPSLSHLDLSSCKLTQMGRNSVDDFSKLMTLNLSSNQLTDIHADTFKGLRSLIHLDLSENKLVYFSEHIFGDQTNLQDLRLNGNEIEGFHDNAFYDDSNLINLDLRDNKLQEVPYTAINKLGSLKTLSLSGNPIHKVTQHTTPNNVQNLVLDDMPLLEEIGPDDLTAFTNLVSLSISGGKGFTKIHNGALKKHFPNLRHVHLDDNWIGTLESDALPWEQLETLTLSGNPWMCDDRLRWMLEADCIKEPVVCAMPGTLKGRDLRTLDAKDLKREVTILPMASIVVSLLAIPVVCACAVFVWRRRRFCPCQSHELQGRYVSVFTRDGDEDSEVRIDVRLKESARRIVAVSNGSADDTHHLVKFGDEKGSKADAYDTEEEEI
ncbi:hypothetical protein EGW08_001346 [Elysia chlorotica]|uniref:LRRCT domain-containing protein n=1 Tax=Elysia chlorotica TaxID=188477 RepID=A0A3S1BWY5_ELYCH|nr:hypothetical protein EGW08_001346 [Elysia chlorotica]